MSIQGRLGAASEPAHALKVHNWLCALKGLSFATYTAAAETLSSSRQAKQREAETGRQPAAGREGQTKRERGRQGQRDEDMELSGH